MRNRCIPLFVPLFVVLCLKALPCQAATLRVTTEYHPNADGLTWETAFASPGHAMESARPGDVVWVAAGEYYGWFQKNGVAVYGGFAGTETSRSQRDVARNRTVVISDISADQGQYTTNVLDGFSLQNAGVSGTTIIIRNNVIRNAAGTGVSVNGVSTVEGNTILGCAHGGVTVTDMATVANNRIEGCQGAPAISVIATAGTSTIANNLVIGNVGGGIQAGGAGSVTIMNNLVAGNHTYAGGIITSSSAPMTLVNNTIAANTSSEEHAAVILSTTGNRVANNIIAFNRAGLDSLLQSGNTVRNNCVYGNAAFDYRGVDPQTNGNISADPIFANMPYGDFHIQPDSPCRDAGSNVDTPAGWPDMDRQVRRQGDTVDIGADESDGTTWPAAPAAFHVHPAGEDANDGATWAAAKRTVQAAVEAAMLRGGGDVYVAGGTYAERVLAIPFLYLYGGCEGIDGGGRDPKAYPSTLDGGGVGNVVRLFGGTSYSVFDGFTIRNGGGASVGQYVSNGGGGLLCIGLSGVIAHNTITGNTATTGGGVYLAFAAPRFHDNVIRGNGATTGAGLVSDFSRADIRNNVISGNVATGLGGGLYMAGFDQWTLANNTIVANMARDGGGVAGYGYCNPPLVNNIIAFNSSGLYHDRLYSTAVPLRNNCIYGNADYDVKGTGDPGTTNGNLRVDPMLAMVPGSPHILPDSPCRNAGDTGIVGPDDTDIDGQPRATDGAVDIGADESMGEAWSTIPPVIRVAADGADANDGSSWDAPRATVQAALDAVGETGGEVWVKAGTYAERVRLSAGVSLYGGFAGSEAAREERDPAANVTTLDGGKAGTVVTADVGTVLSTLDGFTVTNGRAERGGGILCRYATPVISNNVVTANTATTYGGGGIASDHAAPVIRANRVTGNLGSPGGGIAVVDGSRVPITGNEILGNRANGRGGGVYVSSATATVTGNVITGNTGGAEAGGLGSYASVTTAASNLFAGNQTLSTMGVGGAVATDSTLTLRNNTIADNLSNGSAVQIKSTANAVVTLVNNIVARNTKGIFRVAGPPASSRVFLRHNDVFGNAGYNYSGLPDPTGTDGNITADPLFVDPATGDYQLQAASPGLDAGDDRAVAEGETDLLGNPRIRGLHGDMGAYEAAGQVGFRWWDVIRALRIAGGFVADTTGVQARLNVATGGASADRLDLADAAVLARRAAGLDTDY